MQRTLCFAVAVLVCSNMAFAGPLGEAVKRAAQTTRPVRAQPAENHMLWPGVAMIAGGGLLALYGFTHTTGAEINSNDTGTSIGISEKHATGVGVAGLAIAGVGGFLLLKGQNQARPDRRISFGLNQVTVRF